ncbi:zinc finger protein DZIP1L isoform X2 [Centrocercus urophasianus]|uniref:zinc finger protein DZIP1L isoform X2 n=1 Tax=Centrocercus urophasianus TaxID=9002 RepID=UPI001C653B09|nr:zinc finger protein DZIP1L isoform X2 [Centrocercus urophasianus]
MAMLTAPPALTIPPKTFCFQPRCLAMDRHRLSAVDVERVAREGDVAVLQEHISNITFCNMDAERCPHCRQPADPVLLTVLRLAQLSIEYLLHCQQHLADSLAVHAQHLQDARAQLAHAQGLASEQATRLRGEKEESRRWKKLVATQLLLQARPSGYCKGAAGVGRSHPRCSQWLCSPGFAETKKVERMEEEVEELKAKLREMQQQLAAGREAEKLRREQEEKRAHQREAEERRDFERWKEEERMKLHMEMDGLRQHFLTELQDAASRSSAMEGKLQELQAKAAVVSNLGTLQDDDSDLEMTAVQVSMHPCPSHPSPLCASALSTSRVSLGRSKPRNGTRKVPGHAMVPNHASSLELSGSSLHGKAFKAPNKHFAMHQLPSCPVKKGFDMATSLSVEWVGKGTAFKMADVLQDQGKAEFLQAQGQSGAHACKNCPLTVFFSATSPWFWNTCRDGDSPSPWAAVPTPWHLAQKRPGHFSCDLSSSLQTKLLSANKPKDTADDAQRGKKWLLEALWRKPNLLKKFRRILEETLEERLESMGISRAAKGISSQTYQHLQAVLRLQQLQKAKNSPGLLHLRDELIQMVMKRVRQLKKPSIPLPRQLSIIPGTAVSIKGKPLERRLDVKTQRPASGNPIPELNIPQSQPANPPINSRYLT